MEPTENQDAEKKFKKLERFIPFLETFRLKNDTSNENAVKKLEKAKLLLNMIKAGYNG